MPGSEQYRDPVKNDPVAGWYSDPEAAGRLRYWDGQHWTEHIAAPQAAAPVGAAPPLPPAGYRPPLPTHVTLFNNPYQKPPRTKRGAAEASLSLGARARAAAIDAALVIPFIVLGFVLGPVLGWIAGDSEAGKHGYHAAALVLAVGVGGGLAIWNLLIREITLGTEVVLRSDSLAP
ncbi:MAG: hypothetical protein NVSMB48_12530 [Marmoricola sp.]